jgi:hypothetical protein
MKEIKTFDYKRYWETRKPASEMSGEECDQELIQLQDTLDNQKIKSQKEISDAELRKRELYQRLSELNQ